MKSKTRLSSVRTSPSLNRPSIKESFINRPSMSKAHLTSRASIADKSNTYLIEVYVLDDSWPLTKLEWDSVSKLKTMDLIGPPDTFDKRSLLAPFSFHFLDVCRCRARRKSSITFKNAVERKSSVALMVESPYWTLETISNSENPVIPIEDFRRKKRVKAFKRRWYIEDPARYERSKILRYCLLDTIQSVSVSVRKLSFQGNVLEFP